MNLIALDTLPAQTPLPAPPAALVRQAELRKRPDVFAFEFISGASVPRAEILLAQAAPATEREPKIKEERIARMGHSLHGPAFDAGPRQKPWKIEGIGRVHFPITTKNPEVQKWFDQGMTLLHSFWMFEAERAFRWCLKLDPDCAMAYWGLHCSSAYVQIQDLEGTRAPEFLKKAWERRHLVSERERLYIEAWEAVSSLGLAHGENGEKKKGSYKEFERLLGLIIERYPDDLEAKALYGNQGLNSDSVAGRLKGEQVEQMLQQVLAKDANHPGAHHYRLHLWDAYDPARALDSADRYRKIAPRAGHGMHMPGHIYAGLGMWHEGATSQDSATRVEKRYMQEHFVFPFNDWSYSHNRIFLGYFLEQLGRVDAAIAGARELLAVPQDPSYNNPTNFLSPYRVGVISLVRVLTRFERWDELLRSREIPWDLNPQLRVQKDYYQAVAHLSRGEVKRAEESVDAFEARYKTASEQGDDHRLKMLAPIQQKELRGLLLLAQGKTNEGFVEISAAAKEDREFRVIDFDPPTTGRIILNVLGREYLKHGLPAEARQAFEQALQVVPNDGIALAGLIQAHHALGQDGKAAEHLNRLRHVWSGADAGLPWMKEAMALGLKAPGRDVAMVKESPYDPAKLDRLGPAYWEPARAPKLSGRDPSGRRVSLAEYRGRNVLLVFYLGEECPHCMEQLVAISRRHQEFSDLNTAVLAVSSNPPEQNAASLQTRSLPIRLLSDVDFANAKRFHSFDDFEERALHSTLLIDGEGKLRWGQNGGAPFMNFDFLLAEIQRVNGRR